MTYRFKIFFTRKFLSLCLVPSLSLFLSCGSKPKTDEVPMVESDIMKRAYSLSLQGNVKEAIEALRSVPESNLSVSEKNLKEKYTLRFVQKIDEPINEKDPFVKLIIQSYHSYWDKVLMQELNEQGGAEYLFNLLKGIVESEGNLKFKEFSEQEFDRLSTAMEGQLKTRGIHGIFGMTKPHLELMIWKKEENKKYQIPLHDGPEEVEVVLMSDFLSMGWSHYATFGRHYSGGWATKEKLFCVAPAYDLNSESFKVSYLAHEGRHFSDYKKFPVLEQPELEYRAKLTELMMADSTIQELLEKFRAGGENSRKSPHAFANYRVYHDLKDRLAKKDIGNIVAAPPQLVKSISEKLLNENTDALRQKGSKTVKSIL
ncbi:MAG: hypothetical protein KDD22_00630 [Bdellovibrionales bacterium]|nr:hypothetical protein [Bdellovibrionales bacterium]